MSNIEIWANSAQQRFEFSLPYDQVNRIMRHGGYMYTPPHLIVADVIEHTIGFEAFMYAGYAAVMREAMSQ